ncbi:MAG: C10 family peptidase [Bacteroidota bacterium]
MKKIVTFFMLVIFGLSLYATPVSQEAARNVAVSYYKHYNAKISDYTVSDVVVNTYNGLITFYVFNFQSGGYVMVSADDAVIPVLASSETDLYDPNNLAPNESEWLEGYSKEIEYIVTNNIDNTETVKQWKNIEKGVFNDTKAVVTPLCSTTWNQDGYYNDVVESYTQSGVYTGCVATAMAQIMKNWDYPTTGVGSHSYNEPTYGTLSANFGATTYNWGSMPNNVSSPNTAVATLMYHCGVSVNMTYSTGGSGAYSWDVPNALITYFNYSPSAEIQFKDNFTLANWITLLKSELDLPASRPVYYSGDDGSAGHAFVCDGYNASNQFHFNWGWSGWNDGYYAIGSLNPSGYSFNQDNAAVIRIMPSQGQPVANFSANTTTPAVGGSVNFSDASTNSPTTWSWTFEGGTPSTSTSANPANITYSTAGLYLVSLTVSNANGTDTKTRSQYINVGGTPSAWIKQNSAFTTASRGINSICIVNPYIVWAGAYNGTAPTTYIQEFTRTVNGGNTWIPGTVTYTGSTTQAIANMCAFNDTVCYAAMYPGAAANGGYLAKTINGGVTWSIASSPSFASSWLNFVHFFDANNGVCMGDPSGTDYVIYTTSNGGTSWTQVPAANIPNCLSGEYGIVNQFDAYGNTIWFGTTMGRVYKSTDKGLTWTVATTGFSTATYITPVFKDNNTGIIVGTTTSGYSGIKKTINGGSTWTTLTPTGFYVKIPSLDFIPGTSSTWVDVASGPGTGSSYSTNDCTSFLEIDTASTIQYTSVKFYDINTGWAGSFNTSSTDGGIYKWNPGVIVGTNDIEDLTDHISIYPNPASDYLEVEFTEFFGSEATINIYNLLGELVYTQQVSPFFYDVVTVDLTSLKAGIYMVNVDDGTKMVSEKISLIK